MPPKAPLLAFLLLVIVPGLRAATIFQDGFESGTLGPQWKTGSTNNGRASVSSQNGPATGTYHLVLDDSVNDALYSVAESVLTLDLSNKKNVVLTFSAKSLGNEADVPPSGNFTTTRAFDGVSISGDGGTTWRSVQSLAAVSSSWTTYSITLDSSVTSLSTTFGSTFLIRFSEYDNAPAPVDGIAIDDVMVTADDDQRAVLDFPSPVVEGQNNLTGYAFLAFAPATPVVLALSSSPSGQLNLPATVTIPAGATYATFNFSVIDDSLVNLNRTITVSCSCPGVTTSPASLVVQDNDVPVATLTIPAQLTEGTTPTANGKISIDRTPTVAVVLNLSAVPSGELSMPASVTIPAGQTQASFTIQAVDDNKIDGNTLVTVTASNASIATVTAQTTTVDNEVKTLSFTLPGTVSEGGTGSATVKISGTLTTDLSVALSSSNTAQATVPASVTIPAGQTQAVFTISAAENTARDGSRSITVGATAAGFTGANGSVIIRDNEVASYRISTLTDIVNVGNPISVTVTAVDVEGNSISSGSGSVSLSLVLPTGSTQAVTPASVTLANGAWSGSLTLPTVATAPLKLRASDAAGATGDSNAFDILHLMSLTASSMVWDSTRSRIYASVPSTSSSYANKVVAINPATFTVTASATTNNEPTALALTSGAEYLYAALDGNGTIAKINPATMTVLSTFAVGSDAFYGTLYAEDIVTVAGQPNTLIVSQYRKSVSPRHNGVAAYDSGVIRPNKTQDHTGSNRIEPSSDPTVFFGYNNETTEYGFRQLKLSANGMAEVQVKEGLFSGFYNDFHSDGNQAFSDVGEVADGALMKRLGAFTLPSGGGASRPDLASNRVYFLEGTGSSNYYPSAYDKIGAYAPTTFALIKRVSLPSSYDTVGGFIRWGANGLAFRSSAGIVILNSSLLVPSDPAADLAVTVAATPNPATAGTPLTYTVQAVNNGPNTAKNVTLGATLSSGQTLQSTTASSGSPSTSGSLINLPIGNLASGASVTLTITTLPSQAGSLTCTASINSTSVDADFTNNTAFKLVSVGFVSSLDTVNSLGLTANNMVWDSVRRLLWVTVPSTVDAPLGRSIVSIDPSNGLTSDPIAINASPVDKCMALSGSGQYLYVGLSDSPEVARFDLTTSPVTSIRIPLGNSQWGSSNYAEDLEVLDGDGTSFLMAGSGDHAAAVFDSATGRRTNRTGIYTIDRIERTATAGTFVGYNSYTSGFGLATLPVTASGVTASRTVGSLISGYYADIAGSGDVLLSSTGLLVNSNTLSLSFNLGISGRPCVDSSNQRAYIVNGNGLRAFKTTDGTAAGTLALPVTSTGDWAQSCVRWGTNGLAIMGNDGYIYITRWSQANTLDTNMNGIPDAWEMATFGHLGVAPDDDPDHDGIPNALEYVFGTSPTDASGTPMLLKVGGSASVASASGQGGGSTVKDASVASNPTQTVTVEFPRRVGLPAGVYGFESSTDLRTWAPAQSLSETVVATNTSGSFAVDTVQAVIPLPLKKGFVRMVWKTPYQ